MKALIGLVALVGVGAATASPPTAFGIPLGELLVLPECPKDDDGYATKISQPCYKDSSAYAGYDRSSKAIAFPIDALPTGSSNGTLEAMMDGERVIGISFFTDGVSDQSRVLDMLTAKYGKPGTQKIEKVSNMAGGNFDAVTAIWIRDGLTVTLMGTYAGRLDTGRVTIDTPPATARRAATVEKSASRRTPL